MKTKILSLVHGEYASHTVKAVEICKELRKKGDYDILFSGTGSYMRLIEESGFDYIRTPTLSKQHIDNVLETKTIPVMFNNSDADYYYHVEKNLITNTQPKIILRDLFRDMAGIVAKQKYIFDVSLQLASCCPYQNLDFKPKNFPKILDMLIPNKILIEIGKRVKPLVRNKVYKNILKKVKDSGLTPDCKVPEGFEADLVLLADDPLLFPFDNLRSNYKYTGAILSFADTDIPDWQKVFSADPRKKIVITSGSTGVHDKPQTFIDAFGDSKYAVVVYSNKGAFPSNFYGGNAFNLGSVLPYADVLITHGGIGSTYLGLQNKVPMLVLPNHFEQQINGHQLEKFGAGISVHPDEINAKNIIKGIEKILSNGSFKERASYFSENMIKNSVSRAVNYIECGYKKFREDPNCLTFSNH
jgi:UDP:flavonoid glycosyltransferase YjiC (YdhE family)